MSSTFAWLDVSAKERRTMLQVVDLFKEKGTVDELGIGTIRDAFADYFFPGTSTLHTRPRYLLFIAWIYLKLERDRATSAQAASRAHGLQANDLVASLERGGERSDVIGIEARGRLLRVPAEVYWGALRRFQIRIFPGSREQYHATFDAMRSGSARAVIGEDGELLEPGRQTWNTGIPQAPSDLWSSTTFRLTREEAEFLRERILATAPESLLAALAWKPAFGRDIDVPWHEQIVGVAPRKLQIALGHARRFSLLMHGAALAYNLLMAEAAAKAGTRDSEIVDHYRDRIQTWADGEVRPIRKELDGWNRDELWQLVAEIAPSSSVPARRFSEAWISAAIADPWGAPYQADVREVIRRREQALKGGLARLANRRALERWSGGSGLGRMTFRWPNARSILRDLADGLREPAE